MLGIPSIDLAAGRPRIVSWPGAPVVAGAVDLAGIRRLRYARLVGIILGEALLSGRMEYSAAREAAA